MQQQYAAAKQAAAAAAQVAGQGLKPQGSAAAAYYGYYLILPSTTLPAAGVASRCWRRELCGRIRCAGAAGHGLKHMSLQPPQPKG